MRVCVRVRVCACGHVMFFGEHSTYSIFPQTITKICQITDGIYSTECPHYLFCSTITHRDRFSIRDKFRENKGQESERIIYQLYGRSASNSVI